MPHPLLPIRPALFTALIGALVLGCTGAGPNEDDRRDGGAVQPDAGAAAGGWALYSDIPEGPRQEIGVVILDDTLFVVGGYDDNNTFHNTLLRYDIADGTWSEGAPVPQAVHHPNLAVAGGAIYVLGSLAGGFGAQGGTYRYDPLADAWGEAAWLPEGRQRGGGVAGTLPSPDGDKVVVAGGYRNGAVTDVDVYDVRTDTWTAAAPLPEPLDHAFGGVLNGALVVAGGRDTSISALSANTYRYDATADVWTELAPMLTPRAGGASAVHQNRLYTLGGEGNGQLASGVFGEVEVFDASLGAWQVRPPMARPRHGMAAAVHGALLFVPGGADVQAFSAVATFDALRL